MAIAQPHEVLKRLARSSFRRRFRLGRDDLAYMDSRGLPLVMRHVHDFITKRLAPAHPRNDGRQTPLSGHPGFVAQHATATCCRGCLVKWHGIARETALTADQRGYVESVIHAWLTAQLEDAQQRSARVDAEVAS